MTNFQPKYIRLVFELLNAPSHSVKYDAAMTLTTLTQNPAAVKGADWFSLSVSVG
jgi:coatomer subunit beta